MFRLYFQLAFFTAVILFGGCAHAQQDRRFPIGVWTEAVAVFCFDFESAKHIADRKGDVDSSDPKVHRCMWLRGTVIYLRAVYHSGDWAVWEAKTYTGQTLYEATNWVGYIKGQIQSSK